MTDIMKTQIRQLIRRKGIFQFPLIALLITLVLSVLLQSTDNSGKILTASAFLGQFALFPVQFRLSCRAVLWRSAAAMTSRIKRSIMS